MRISVQQICNAPHCFYFDLLSPVIKFTQGNSSRNQPHHKGTKTVVGLGYKKIYEKDTLANFLRVGVCWNDSTLASTNTLSA